VPSDGCTPLALDTTGKYLYILAHNSTLSTTATNAPSEGRAGKAPEAPWTIVTMALADGSIPFTTPMPTAFPPTLPACAHALTEDGSSHVYVAAVVPASTANGTNATARLVAGVLTTEGPSKHGYVGLADVPLSVLSPLGPPLATPVASVSDYALWFAFSGGLAGVNVSTGAVDRQLVLPQGQTLVGLQYDVAQLTTYGLLVGREGGGQPAQLVLFVDGPSSQGLPAVTVVGPAPSPLRPNTATLVSDKGGYCVLAASNGTLVTLALDGSGATGVTPSPCSTTSGVGCPLALAYEPFVF
jgi:hypothetical protein